MGVWTDRNDDRGTVRDHVRKEEQSRKTDCEIPGQELTRVPRLKKLDRIYKKNRKRRKSRRNFCRKW